MCFPPRRSLGAELLQGRQGGQGGGLSQDLTVHVIQSSIFPPLFPFFSFSFFALEL